MSTNNNPTWTHSYISLSGKTVKSRPLYLEENGSLTHNIVTNENGAGVWIAKKALTLLNENNTGNPARDPASDQAVGTEK